MRSILKLCIALAIAGIGCQGSSSTASSAGGVPSSSASGNAPGSTAASSSGGSSAASSTGTTGGSPSGSGTTGTSAGSSTGRPPPIYIDGGYVRCEASVLTDAGQEALAWECRPGTYFCATDGTRTCAQCLSDSDCTNYDLPTFDPNRPYCDLSSGVSGYQGFCQQCLISGHCAGSPATPTCDLDPNDWSPPIQNTGFETCERTPLGCAPGTSGVPGAIAPAGFD